MRTVYLYKICKFTFRASYFFSLIHSHIIFQVKKNLNVIEDSPPRRLLASRANGSAAYLESLKKCSAEVVDTRPQSSSKSHSVGEYVGNRTVKDSSHDASHTHLPSHPKLNILTNILQRKAKNQLQSNPASLHLNKRVSIFGEEKVESTGEYRMEASATTVLPERSSIIDATRSSPLNKELQVPTTSKALRVAQESAPVASMSTGSLQTVFARAGKQISSACPPSSTLEIPIRGHPYHAQRREAGSVLNTESTSHNVNHDHLEHYTDDIWNSKKATRKQFNDDNFVRRNLKKKTSSSSYHKRMNVKRQSQLSAHSEHNSATTTGLHPHTDSVESNPYDDEIGEAGSSPAVEGPAVSTSSCITEISGGLVAWGLDPLELSLKAIQNPGQKVSECPLDKAPKTSVSQWRALQSEQGDKVIRGLHVLSGKKSESSKGRKGNSNAVMNDEIFEKHAPKCPGHQMAGKLLTVRKAGPNRVIFILLWRLFCLSLCGIFSL